MATLVNRVEVERTTPVAARNGRANLLGAAAGNLHFLIVGLLAAALLPALRATALPLRFAWPDLLQAWVGLMFQAVFLATVLYALTGPLRSTLGPVLHRYWSDKRRLLLLLPFFGGAIWLYGFGIGLVLTVAVLAGFELMDRSRLGPRSFAGRVQDVMLPAAYLFVGLVLVFAYNNVIVSMRFYGAYDAAFSRIDSRILGTTVSEIARRAGQVLPAPAFKFLEFVYFGMFSQIGAGIILTALGAGRARAFKLVGALLMAYVLALICFYLWPSHGPYYSCPDHFTHFPQQLRAYATQKMLLLRASSVWSGKGIGSIGTDYYIAFPCMHIAQPLIVMWFLRRWRRVVGALAIVNVVLAAAILLLEWHYFVDLLGGLAVAVLAVLLVDRSSSVAAVSPPPTPS